MSSVGFGPAPSNSPTSTDADVDVDVIVAGAGPTGLMLAGELCLAGVRPLVLERRPQLDESPKANGLGGQILELLHYRGLLERFEGASGSHSFPAPHIPFGGVHLDFTHLADPPLRALSIAQAELERLLDERAREIGAVLRRGHEVTDVGQDGATVCVDVRGPEGPYRVTGRYLVGCDGPSSRVRQVAGIPFPGTTYPETNRLAQVALPASVAQLENGDLEVPGLGLLRAGFTRTDRGVFAFGRIGPGVLLVQSTEYEPVDCDDDEPMTLTEFRNSIHRVLGADLPFQEAFRLSRFTFQARQAERYRDGRILLAGDAAHQFPATGIALNVGMLDAVNVAWKLAAHVHSWAPAGLLDTYHAERHFAATRALLQTQAQVALRRGQDSAADALRALFLELSADEQPLRRLGALVAGTEIRSPLPAPDDHPMTGTFAPDLTLSPRSGLVSQGTRSASSVAELMHAARPVLLDLADRRELHETARLWRHRVDIHTAGTDGRPADAFLIRPDAHIAWAATIDEPTETAARGLREALNRWFGPP